MAIVFKFMGGFLLTVGMLLGVFLAQLPQGLLPNEINFLPAVMIVAGGFFYWRGRQYAARAAAQTTRADSRPSVLFLRDFRSDPSTLGQAFSTLLRMTTLSGLSTEEEQLAAVMQPFGDLIAIGKPGEALPTPGAARQYASDEEWQDVVSNRIREARFVVIRAGSGEGLLWELKRVVELMDPQKLLLLLFRMKRRHYRQFRDKASAIFRVALPAPERCARFGRISGFITFSADWTPSFLPLKAPLWRRSPYKPVQRMFQFALKPIFEAAGVEWKRPPVSPLRVFAVVASGLFGLLSLWVVWVIV